MKKKILVVDDCPVVLTMLDDLLSNLNYAVTTAENGHEACRQIAQTKYNMIITDLNMPGMDGIEFTRKAKEAPNCKFVPIVMLSSENDETRIGKARQMGISTFLRKPVREAQLKTILQVVLGA